MATAQITAPGRDWAATTQYVNSAIEQDSIFVFFANTGKLKATHSSGKLSTFEWYRYNASIPTPANRFQQLQSVSDQISSELSNLEEGGYRVIITDTDGAVDTLTAWLFTDNLVLNRIDYDSKCQFLELNAITTPNSYNVENDRFVYYDLSRKATHPEVNTYGRGYFKDITWDASESRVEFLSSSSLRQIIEKTAPLYNSSYSVNVTNIFGREMSAQTQTITAIATKAVQKVQAEKDGTWADYVNGDNYEALLKLQLESSSINADSIYWHLSKQTSSGFLETYDIIWKDSAIITNRNEAIPDERLMRPGYFKLKHWAVNSTSGCKDSVEIEIKVDSAKISPEAIPNVFTPNSSTNKMFKFIEPETNIKSIKYFTIRIFARSGRLIYEYAGNPKEWEGWDGKIKGTGAEAAEGVYFFIIEAKGWDGKEFDYGPYKGFLHLYRGGK